eukprot:COSAG04_NODE_291_length_17813_cov_32.336231_15_plen_127_part_00
MFVVMMFVAMILPADKLGNQNDVRSSLVHDCLCRQVASLALLNNLLELRADSGRLCRLYRRPIPYGASDIGTWYAIFQVISFMAVTTNCGKARQLGFARSKARLVSKARLDLDATKTRLGTYCRLD